MLVRRESPDPPERARPAGLASGLEGMGLWGLGEAVLNFPQRRATLIRSHWDSVTKSAVNASGGRNLFVDESPSPIARLPINWAMPPIVRDRAITLPILAGALKGRWWAPGSGGKLGRLFLGTYEADQTPLFCRHVSKGDTVIDLGANVGYYTLLASRLVGPSGSVIACEPEPLNAAYLRRHVSKNRLENTTVLETAVGAKSGVVGFTRGLGRSRGHVDAAGELTVPVETLDEIASAHDLVPNVMKIDVEGAEFEVLEGGSRTLRAHRPVIFLSTHGRDVHASCCSLLTGLGYRLTVIDEQPLPEARKLLAVAS